MFPWNPEPIYIYITAMLQGKEYEIQNVTSILKFFDYKYINNHLQKSPSCLTNYIYIIYIYIAIVGKFVIVGNFAIVDR